MRGTGYKALQTGRRQLSREEAKENGGLAVLRSRMESRKDGSLGHGACAGNSV